MFLKQAINLGGHEITIETGRIAKQADGRRQAHIKTNVPKHAGFVGWSGYIKSLRAAKNADFNAIAARALVEDDTGFGLQCKNGAVTGRH